MILLLALAAATAAPSPEALRLGRELAEAGTLAHLLPLMETAQTAELIGDNPDLKPADQAALKATAHQVFLAGRERLMQGEAASYATLLSIDDLRRVAAFERSPAGTRYRESIPKVITGTMATVGKMDFKADVRAAYRKQSGKLCTKP